MPSQTAILLFLNSRCDVVISKQNLVEGDDDFLMVQEQCGTFLLEERAKYVEKIGG